MNLLTDENLVALADGAVTPEERLVMERQLAGDSEARRQLLLLRLSGAAMREAFTLAELEGNAARSSSVTSMGVECRVPRFALGSRFRCHRPGKAAAVAACLAIAMGLYFADRHMRAQGTAESPVAIGPVPQGALSRLLDRTALDGAYLPARTATTDFLVVASMRDRQGKPCHEVHHYSEARDTAHALPSLLLACRMEPLGRSIVGAVAPTHSPTTPDGMVDERARAALDELMVMIGARRAVASNEEEHDKK